MKKVLIANRGEIAVRIIRACHDLGLQTVAIYSTADAESLHVLHADEAVCIGEPQARHSYLKIPNIIAACEITGADMVHPGYGFLSENSHFASIVASCGLTFIGPSAESIAMLGDKAQAKAIAREVKCPVIPGSLGVVSDLETALAEAKRIGYPLLIKAVAGGGGRGIRIVEDPDTFSKHFSSARTEAEAAFGNPDVYLEKMIIGPRHCEVQVLADTHGNVIHLGERDCTIQRRRQKLIEESPSPILTPKMRERMGEAAVAIAKRANYASAGTVEFLVDREHNFYFMEMNTRIQVEHPVTEARTGIDLVKEQLRIAMGEKLTVRQKDVLMEGHSMEFRINAEDPANNFAPSPCKIEYFLPPGGPGVRVDSACYAGYTIPTHYDSMVAKLIVHGKTREEAMAIARRALREFHIGGIKSTVPFHLAMLKDPKFVKGTDYDIKYIDGLMDRGVTFVAE